VKRIIIPDVETFLTAIQDELSQPTIFTTSIDWKCFAMFFRAIILMKRPRFLTILHAPFTIGCIGCWIEDLAAYRMSLDQDGQPVYLRINENRYLKTCCTLPEKWVMTKIFGMAYSFAIIWPKNTGFILKSAVARVFSMSWALACKDLALKPVKLTSPSKQF
jgi:hypothetical protein